RGSVTINKANNSKDPRSIPNASISRIIWAISIALLTFILRNYFFLSTAVFWALFTLAPLTILLDKFWVIPRFMWQNKTEIPDCKATLYTEI
ncbi:MAG: hypothetical protein ACKPCP_09305, partial [Sphaerospermopsis kisseleviana]